MRRPDNKQGNKTVVGKICEARDAIAQHSDEAFLGQLCPAKLGKTWDGVFSDPEAVGQIVDSLLEQSPCMPRSLSGPPEDLLKSDILCSIRNQGCETTYSHASQVRKKQLSQLYWRMLFDAEYVLAVQDSIWKDDDLTPFWTAKIYSPLVRLYDLERLVSPGDEEEVGRPPHLSADFRIEGSDWEAVIGGLEEFADREAEFVLRPLRPTEPPGIAKRNHQACNGLAQWWANWASEQPFCSNWRGKTRVSADGKASFTIRNRPENVELMNSVLAIAILQREG